MKSAGRFNTIKLIFLFFSFCALFISCGLDTIILIDPPTIRDNSPTYSTEEYAILYIDFQTNESSANMNIEGGAFLGTDVFYKIFNNYKDATSYQSAIENLNTTSNGDAAAARMIDTYKYQPLLKKVRRADGTVLQVSDSVFVPQKGSSRKIYFRPLTYASSDAIDLRSSIAIPHGYNSTYGGEVYSYMGYDPTKGAVTYNWVKATNEWYDTNGASLNYADLIFFEPYRNLSGKNRSFDFFDQNDTNYDENVEPVDGDEDYKHNETWSDENKATYYVHFYAVGVANDTTSCTLSYSLVLDLGIIPIRKNSN